MMIKIISDTLRKSYICYNISDKKICAGELISGPVKTKIFTDSLRAIDLILKQKHINYLLE